MPEDERERHELIEGVIVERGAASGEHGAAQFKLCSVVEPFHHRVGGRWPGGWWFGLGVHVRFTR